MFSKLKLNLISNRIRSLTNTQLLRLDQFNYSVGFSGQMARLSGFTDPLTKRQCQPVLGSPFGLTIYHKHPQNCGLVANAISNLFKINSAQHRFVGQQIDSRRLQNVLTRTQSDLMISITIQFIRTSPQQTHRVDGGHSFCVLRVGTHYEIFQSDENHYYMRESHRKLLTQTQFTCFLSLITQCNFNRQISSELAQMYAKIMDPSLPFNSILTSPIDAHIYQFDEIDLSATILSLPSWTPIGIIANVNHVII